MMIDRVFNVAAPHHPQGEGRSRPGDVEQVDEVSPHWVKFHTFTRPTFMSGDKDQSGVILEFLEVIPESTWPYNHSGISRGSDMDNPRHRGGTDPPPRESQCHDGAGPGRQLASGSYVN